MRGRCRSRSSTRISRRFDGRTRLLDFGIAKIAGHVRTRPGDALGTPHYMAPEQVRGDAVVARAERPLSLSTSTAFCAYSICSKYQPSIGRAVPYWAILPEASFFVSFSATSRVSSQERGGLVERFAARAAGHDVAGDLRRAGMGCVADRGGDVLRQVGQHRAR